MKQSTKASFRLSTAKILLSLATSFLLAGIAYGQAPPAGTVTGTVKGNNEEPVSDVTVSVKNQSRIMSRTDQDGRFTIKADSNATLVFTHVSYAPREIKVGRSKVINLVMQGQGNNLNDVIVIGYGTTTKKDQTGSIGVVNMEQMSKAVVKSFDDALGGRVAGVSVISPDGQPGANSNIVIRGGTSITQDNSPLYVIDGFPIENYDQNSINPSDIESISVLKDASSTAIFGSRGANGVIIITTKRGKAGPPTITYNGYYGIQKDGHRIPVLSPYEFVKLQVELGTTASKPYLDDVGKTLEDYRNVKGIDWYDKVFQTAPQMSHNISLLGGNDKTKYSLSLSAFNQDGIVIKSGFRRYQGRITLDQTVNSKMKVGLNLNFSNYKDYGTLLNSNGGTATFMFQVWGYRPVTATDDVNIEETLTDPDILNGPQRVNPFLQVQNEIRESITNKGEARLSIDYKLTKDLALRITGGADLLAGRKPAFSNSKTKANSFFTGSVLGVNGRQDFNGLTNLSSQATLTYNKLFAGKHRLIAMTGYEITKINSYSFGALASYVPNEDLTISGLDEGTPYSIASNSSNRAFQAVFVRAIYDYKSKFYLTGTVRADGTSKFAPGHKWGYFPSAAFKYSLIEERFMKRSKIISDAKVRVSYGTVGSANGGRDFPYANSMGFVNVGYPFNNSVLQGAAPSALGNPYLEWESTAETNLALDLGFFRNRINLTAEIYKRTTSNLLLDAKLPNTTGYASALKNIGKLSNKGIELTLNTVNIESKQFRWTSNLNISFNRNKVIELSENQESVATNVNSASTAQYLAKIGYPVGMFYGVIFDGLYQYEDFNLTADGKYILKDELTSNNIGSTRSSIRPGFSKFRDLNNDGIINNNDFTIIGNPNPDFIGGFINDFQYKGFDLSVFLQFSYGNEVLNANRLIMEEGRSVATNQYATYANRWSPTNTSSVIPVSNGGTLTNYNTSRIIEDGSFLRGKTISLGYSISRNALKKIKIQSLRVYVTGQNLFTVTNYSGADPEVSTRNSALTPAYDNSSYPRTRTYVGGVTLTF